MPGWAIDMIGVFLGAFLGATLGYAANWWHQCQQTKARRAMLFRTLHQQFSAIPWTPAGFDPNASMHRSTFHVTAARQLLDGYTLDANRDADLARALTFWESAQQRHNEAVFLTNMAVITPGTSHKVIEACAQHLDSQHQSMRMQMRFVEKFLPPDRDYPYSHPDPWPDPEILPADQGQVPADE